MQLKKPNFIVFMPDQLRADSIGTFGKSIVQTPNFDRLASLGVAFENCFVQHTVCTPSRCSIMTGWYPHVRGHRTLNYLLHEDEPNLMKYLRNAGYWVEWHGKNDLLNYKSFEESVDHRGKIEGKQNTFIPNPWDEGHHLRRSFYFGKRPDDMAYDHDYFVIENAINFLKNRPADKPFFLYLPLIYPHPPYNIEEPYFSMYDRTKVPSPAKAEYSTKPRFVRKYHELHWMDKVSEEEQKEIIATYYGMITRTDALFGKILDVVEQEGLMDDTAIFVFSDHGDYTCDYGLVEKWWTGLTDNLVRVPLIIKYPGMKCNNLKLDNLVESIDLFPTIMELAGINNYHEQFGKSLLPLINGEINTHREYVFAEGGHHPQDLHCKEELLQGIYYPKTYLQREDFRYIHKAVMIRSDKWKYIKHLNDIPELYNMKEDPKEERNLALEPEYKDIILEMEQQLLRWYMETCDNVPLELDTRDIPGF